MEWLTIFVQCKGGVKYIHYGFDPLIAGGKVFGRMACQIIEKLPRKIVKDKPGVSVWSCEAALVRRSS